MLKFLRTFVVAMKLSAAILKPVVRRKLVTTLFIGASLAAFATLGDGGNNVKNATLREKNILALPSAPVNYKTFSLKSGYNFRGNSFLNTAPKEKFVMLNTVMTYQKGNTTYILPLKKKLLLNNVTFKPAAPQR